LTDLVALNNLTHRGPRVAVDRAWRDHASVNVVGVVPREFPRLLAQYPVFFAKSPESGQFEPAALLGFASGENLFLEDHGWDAPYVPLQIRRRPFELLQRRADPVAGIPASLDLALDMESPHVQAPNGERLFEDDGSATPLLQNISSIMNALVAGSREAHNYTARLAELNLIEPVRIDIEFVDLSETKLAGLYWIAAAAVKALTPPQLAELRDREYLEWMYFQMASLAHVAALVARKNKRISGATAARGWTDHGAGR